MIRQSLSRFIPVSSPFSSPLFRCFSSSASPHVVHTSPSSGSSIHSLFYPPSPQTVSYQPKFLLPPDLFVTATPSKSNRLFSSHVEEQISHYARRQQQGVTLKQMLDIGPSPSSEAVIRNARFLYEELPVRLAKRVRELESLPYGLSQTAPVLKVKSWYVQSFRDILSCNEPVTHDEDQQFAATLEKILERHANVVPTIAAGVLHLKRQLGGERADIVTQCPFLQDFLNRFYASRIGIRLLIAQHVALHHPRPGWIGCVAMDMNPIHVAEEAAADAINICEREYGKAPEIKIIAESVKGLSFIPAHLHHIVFELLKNSLRAIVENNVNKSDYPTVELILVCENREFALKIADQGGGIPRKDMPRIWTYMHTTAKKPAHDLLNPSGDVHSIVGGGSYGSHGANTGSAPMAGFGYGLPLSRLTARYFGGDLQLVSTHGHGTDAYLYLTRLEDLNIVME